MAPDDRPESLVQYEVADGVCLLRLNAPPVNAVTPALLEALEAALDRAEADPAVRGIVLTGGPEHFSAGADVELFRQVRTAADAEGLSRRFQEAMDRVEGSGKCVVAAVAGRLLGSAVELAMACHWRLCAEGSAFGLPEVTLGINPGAGGTQRLVRLVGPERAMKMLLSGRTIPAPEALEAGLVDEVCPPAALLERAGAAARSRPPRRTCRTTDKVADAQAVAAAMEAAEAEAGRTREEIIAPRVILEAVRTGLAEGVAAGMRAEQTGFAACMATPAARNFIYLFFATRQMPRAEELAGVPARAVEKAGVVGMGSMGTGIAHALLLGGAAVTVFETDPAALERGTARIRRSLEKRLAAGRTTPAKVEAMLSRLATTTDAADLAGAELVVEAVYEDPAAKREVLARLEDVCGEQAVLATNTSTISLDRLAEGMRRPGRLVGMHFFNPAHRMPLVEVVRREGASPEALATAMAFAKAVGKTPVLVANREGFLVNRIFVPYFKEAFYLLEDGAAPEEIDAAMVAFGFPMGPLTLIDMAGIDILAHVDAVMAEAFPRHGRLSAVARRLVAGGLCGQKSGAGVYKYERGDRTARPNPATEAILAEVRAGRGGPSTPPGREEITRRLVGRMVAEAFYVLGEGIARRESDIDAAMVLGTGFPAFRGGVLRYARDRGLGAVLAELNELADRVGERFAPCELLRRMEGAK